MKRILSLVTCGGGAFFYQLPQADAAMITTAPARKEFSVQGFIDGLEEHLGSGASG